jgi:hypothetical protein
MSEERQRPTVEEGWTERRHQDWTQEATYGAQCRRFRRGKPKCPQGT